MRAGIGLGRRGRDGRFLDGTGTDGSPALLLPARLRPALAVRPPTFCEQARRSPAAPVVGHDTLARIGDLRYDPVGETPGQALGKIRGPGARCLVFDRLSPDGRIGSVEDPRAIHPGLIAPADRVRAGGGIATRDFLRRPGGQRT